MENRQTVLESKFPYMTLLFLPLVKHYLSSKNGNGKSGKGWERLWERLRENGVIQGSSLSLFSVICNCARKGSEI